MVSELDTYRTAAILIREHGEDAALEAAQRADSFLEKGNMEGVRIWKAILKAVEELQRKEAAPGAPLH